MSRRTVLLAAMAAIAGCQGPNSTTSAFKFPTPSLNLLAPYGPPRIPPPATYSYGQSGLAPPAAASNYYPGAVNARGVSLPQTPESDAEKTAPAQGKVAQAVWKSSRPPAGAENDAAESEASLVSYESSGDGNGAILIRESAEPAQPANLILGGMRAHDLTRALPREQVQLGGVIMAAPATTLASASQPALATQVIYAAPVAARTAKSASSPVATPAASGATSAGGLPEITDLPQTAAPAGNRTLQRVRGYEKPAGGAVAEPSPDNFISPEMTISATAALKARDAVAAAAVESESTIVKPVSTGSSPGWKSRYSTDES